MNPCPCGYAGSSLDECPCSPEQIKRYLAKLSGPLLDRIDMQVEVPKLSPEILTGIEQKEEEASQYVKARVLKARDLQFKRQGQYNSLLTVTQLEEVAHLQKNALQLLTQVMTKFNFSARIYHRIIKLARTMADIEEKHDIDEKHISEALTYRSLDRLKAKNV
jgi:magnesium chelatase family protein